jgi:hypothetical protein
MRRWARRSEQAVVVRPARSTRESARRSAPPAPATGGRAGHRRGARRFDSDHRAPVGHAQDSPDPRDPRTSDRRGAPRGRRWPRGCCSTPSARKGHQRPREPHRTIKPRNAPGTRQNQPRETPDRAASDSSKRKSAAGAAGLAVRAFPSITTSVHPGARANDLALRLPSSPVVSVDLHELMRIGGSGFLTRCQPDGVQCPLAGLAAGIAPSRCRPHRHHRPPATRRPGGPPRCR